MEGRICFNLLPPLHLNIINKATPDKVAPLGKVRVRTILKLTASGEADALDVPVSVEQILVSPEDDASDDAATTITVTAKGITNAIGTTVPNGTKLTIYVPYGIQTGGSPAPEAPSNPQLCLYEIIDGELTIQYSPSGGCLDAGEHSLTVMEFRQYFPGEQVWLGKNIGNAEIRLKGTQ